MKLKWIAPLALIASLSGAMHADTLNYTFSLFQAGTLDGVAFGNSYIYDSGAAVTFNMTADSANVTTKAGTYPMYAITGPITVSVAGIGMDTITDPISIYENTNQLVFGLTDNTTTSNFNTLAFNCYFGCAPFDYLTAPLGPSGGPHTSGGGTYNTAHGSLVLINSPSYFSFQITEANVASTPEPSSLILLGSGAMGLIAMLRKRCRNDGA